MSNVRYDQATGQLQYVSREGNRSGGGAQWSNVPMGGGGGGGGGGRGGRGRGAITWVYTGRGRKPIGRGSGVPVGKGPGRAGGGRGAAAAGPRAGGAVKRATLQQTLRLARPDLDPDSNWTLAVADEITRALLQLGWRR